MIAALGQFFEFKTYTHMHTHNRVLGKKINPLINLFLANR